MPKHSSSKIVSMVDLAEKDRNSVHSRMDADMELYILSPYQGETDENGEPLMDDFKKVTSNDPRNYANLSIHLISSGKRTFVVPQQQQMQQDQRKVRNLKELFTLGIFSSADERRNNLTQPPLQAALAFQTTVRGRWAQRAVLVKEEIDPTDEQIAEREQFEALGLADLLPDTPNTRTYVDISDWDPRNTYWGMGRHGITWACHKQLKSDEEIREQYPDIKMPPLRGDTPSQERNREVYEYFDETDSIVIVAGADEEAKSRVPHGMGRVPVSIGVVGSMPFMQAAGEDYQEHYGESIFANDREIFDLTNFNLSYMAEMCKRALNQSWVYESEDGNKSLEESPNIDGQVFSIKSQGREGLNPVPQQEIIQTTGVLVPLTQGMQQRGGFTDTTFGQLGGQNLSGFAITRLALGQELNIGAQVNATRLAMQSIANIIADGFATGNFDAMTLSGRQQDAFRTYFSEEITAEMVKQGGKIEVRLEPELPRDDAAKVALAQLMREGDVPLADDRFLRENVLLIQDADGMESAIFEQMAKRGSPLALAFQSALAAEEEGDKELQQLWETEFQILLMQKMFELQQTKAVIAQGQQTQGPGQENPGTGQARGTSRVSSGTLPAPVQGIPPPTPTPQQGPIASPNTPRPNAQRPGIPMGVIG